jgi:predicted nucleic acid-binding protein
MFSENFFKLYHYPTVYLDATIPSFYYEERPGTIIQAWREITVAFWDHARSHYDVDVSDETLRELEDVGYPPSKREQCLALVAAVPRLAVNPEVIDLAGFYVREGVMPSNDLGDAIHLAVATWYRLQYLLTWNCKHLANANKFEHIQILNSRRRLVSPAIVTPEQLLEVNP